MFRSSAIPKLTVESVGVGRAAYAWLMDEDEDDFEDEPDITWTEEARARVRAAAEQLMVTVQTHAGTLTALGGERDMQAVFNANKQLAESASAYADAQFDLTHTGWPLGLIEVDDAVDDDDDDDDDEHPSISILSRADYLVHDRQALMEAGYAAYIENREGKPTVEDAPVLVTHLGQVLYEIADAADSWQVLNRTPGLEPANATTWVVDGELPPLTGEPDDDPFVAPEGGWQMLYGQSDIYRS